MRKITGLLTLVVAYALLVPGLTQPILTVTGTIEKSKLIELGKQFVEESPTKLGLMGDMAKVLLNNLKVDGTLPAFDKTRSILGTVQDLLDSGNVLVAVLIVTFSVVIPVIKGLLTLATQFPISARLARPMTWMSDHMSKWSMADVFVIAIFISLLAAKGVREDTGLVNFDASLGSGFYFFLGYCLLSIVSAQILYAGTSRDKPVHTTKPVP